MKRHACELFELAPHELAGFWSEVALVAKALDGIYQPTKINYCIFGRLCPHLHCHLLVHSFEDDPHKPLDMNEQVALLPNEEYHAMTRQLQGAIRAILSAVE